MNVKDATELTGANWQTPVRSGAEGQCVDVATDLPTLPGHVAVRHSKNPAGPAIVYTDAEWAAFVGSVADGQYTKHA